MLPLMVNKDEYIYITLPQPSPLLVKRMPTTTRAASRSTAHHGLASYCVLMQLLSTFISSGSLLPSTALDDTYAPNVGSFHTLLMKVGWCSATLLLVLPSTAANDCST